jgi:nucleoside-diphosphate-sugar epimerase
VPYGLSIDVTTVILDAVLEDRPVFAAHDPQPYSVIHIDDMCEQIPALLGAAAVPATIVNWASDEVFTVQEIAELAGELTGKTPTFQISNAPGVAKGGVVDTTRVREIVGPCKRKFRDEFARICAARSSG